jgi:hypothetical protein
VVLLCWYCLLCECGLQLRIRASTHADGRPSHTCEPPPQPPPTFVTNFVKLALPRSHTPAAVHMATRAQLHPEHPLPHMPQPSRSCALAAAKTCRA